QRPLEEDRRAPNRFERAHGRIDASWDDQLGQFEQGLISRSHLSHCILSGSTSTWNKAVNACAARQLSETWNSAEIAANASAPASTRAPPLSGVMPPIATTGRSTTARAPRSSSSGALAAPGFT